MHALLHARTSPEGGEATVTRRLSGFSSALVSSHRQAELSSPADAHRENDCGTRYCRCEQRHGDGDVATGIEEIDPYRARIFENEIDQCGSQHHGDRHGDPSAADTRVMSAIQRVRRRFRVRSLDFTAL